MVETIFLICAVLLIMTVLLSGLSWFLGKYRRITGAVILASVPLVVWASHYARALGDMPELTPDQQWHKIYMTIIGWGIPAALLIGCVMGWLLSQREYRANFPSSKDVDDWRK